MSIPITDKYLLYKPGLGNEADIRVLNHNTDNIDNGMYQNRLMIGAGYDPDRTSQNPYMKDNLVVKQTTIYDEDNNPTSYSFQLYKCDYDNTYGPWDASKWHITDIATELLLAGSGGGGGSTHNYSTTATKVGEWIDGRDVMEVVWDFNGSSKTISTNDYTDTYAWGNTYRLPYGAVPLSATAVSVTGNGIGGNWVMYPLGIWQGNSNETMSFYSNCPNAISAYQIIITYIAPAS